LALRLAAMALVTRMVAAISMLSPFLSLASHRFVHVTVAGLVTVLARRHAGVCVPVSLDMRRAAYRCSPR